MAGGARRRQAGEVPFGGGQTGRNEGFTGGGRTGEEEKPAVPVDKEASTGWKTHLTKAGYAPSTINAMLSSLNGFFGFLGWEECRVKFLKIQRRAFREREKDVCPECGISRWRHFPGDGQTSP